MADAVRYRAVIFDLDGTLLDTERLVVAAGHRVFGRLGLTVDNDFFLAMVGRDEATCDRMIANRFPELDRRALDAEWVEERRTLYHRGIDLRPTVATLLDRLGGLDVRLAVATSSREESAALKLESTGLGRHFETVVTADDVAERKPAPEPYLLAARRLGISPVDCIAFEDSVAGVTSAHAAGMTVVHVPDVNRTPAEGARYTAETILLGAEMAGLLA